MKPAGPIDAVIFDMDGLLIDSERVVRDAMFAAAREMEVELPLEVFLSMVGTTMEASTSIARAHFGAGFDLAAYDAAVEARVHAELAAGAELKAGVLEILDHLDAAAIRCAVATSSSHATVRRHLAPVLDRFRTVVAAGDYARGKPAPDPYLLAAERLGAAPSRCLALEDSHNGVRAAHAAGMMTIMVPDLLAPTAEMRALCHAIAESLHDVRAMLERGLPTRSPVSPS